MANAIPTDDVRADVLGDIGDLLPHVPPGDVVQMFAAVSLFDLQRIRLEFEIALENARTKALDDAREAWVERGT